MSARLIIVANRLPFSIRQSPTGLEWLASPGGLSSALGPVQHHYDAEWIGWSGFDRPLTPTEEKQLDLPPHTHIVDIPNDVYHGHYYAVTNGVLWPVLHGLKPRRMYSETDWRLYERANQLFADRLQQLVQPNDTIWIQDFHLFLLPGMLRKAGLKNRIGFFLHVPVADPDLLQTLPHSQELLASLAATDLCGVQTAADASRLRSCFQGQLAPPHIAPFPIGIDYLAYRNAVRPDRSVPSPPKTEQTTILSISRLDYTKGILDQLRGVAELARRLPHANIRYKLVVAPSREGLAEYRDLKRDIDALVKEINQNHPGLVDYKYRNLNQQEMAEQYRLADILLVTPIIDGMNLIIKEYVAARPSAGVLVISRTAGAAQQLREALQVNPQQPKAIADALEQALAMPAGETQRRWRALQHNVQTEDVFHWAASFLHALKG